MRLTTKLAFSSTLLIALLLGVLLPQYMQILNSHGVMAALIIVLYFSFLKLDLKEVFSHVKRPGLLGYCLLFNLMILPVIAYLATFFISESLVRICWRPTPKKSASEVVPKRCCPRPIETV